MMTLEQVTIKNFRGFDLLNIEGLSKVNLFVGQNNSGKTSVLESLFLILGMSNPTLPSMVNTIRGFGSNTRQGGSQQLKYLFHKLQLDTPPSFLCPIFRFLRALVRTKS